MLLKNLKLIAYDYIDMMFKYFKFIKEEAEKECDKAGEKCESVSESDLNS